MGKCKTGKTQCRCYVTKVVLGFYFDWGGSFMAELHFELPSFGLLLVLGFFFSK